MKKLLLLSILLMPTAGIARVPADSTFMFRFLAGRDAFNIPWAGNDKELERLYAAVDAHRAAIVEGRMPVYVDGYSASQPTVKENLRLAFVRANRVKSELILHEGLQETHFVTGNHATAHHDDKDLVVVTLRIPIREEPDAALMERHHRERTEREGRARAERERIDRERAQAEKARAERERTEAERRAREQPEADVAQPHAEAAVPAKLYRLAVRTNVLYDAMVLPTLGVEWRIDPAVGIGLDGSLAWWGGEHGKVQKMWLLKAEVRWYPLREKRFYAGASARFGEYNLYKYAIGGMASKDTGYQGSIWGAGVTVGYQLRLSSRFSVDFDLGLGYTRFEYDGFTVTHGVRVYKDRNRSENFWGPTQAGISLVWTIGRSE